MTFLTPVNKSKLQSGLCVPFFCSADGNERKQPCCLLKIAQKCLITQNVTPDGMANAAGAAAAV